VSYIVQHRCSIGMGSSRMEPAMRMVFPSLRSAQLHKMLHFFTHSTFRIRLGRTGTIAIIPRSNGLSTSISLRRYHISKNTISSDGLRGPLVIYDANDPLSYLYDVDDGKSLKTRSLCYQLSTHTSVRDNRYNNCRLVKSQIHLLAAMYRHAHASAGIISWPQSCVT
jgi:hypothetical protein